MKNFLILLFLVIGSPIFAQKTIDNPLKEKVRFSVKVGWLHSDITGKDVHFLARHGKTDPHDNFFVGVGVDNPIGNRFGLKHELFFQNYGSEFIREIDGNQVDAKLKMYGIRINPISLTYRLEGIHLFGGPFINVLTNSSITALDQNGKKYNDHAIFGTAGNDQAGTHYLQHTDYGFVIGAEYHFEFGGLIGLRFSKGLATIFDNSNSYDLYGDDAPDNLRIYNQDLGVYVGYRF